VIWLQKETTEKKRGVRKTQKHIKNIMKPTTFTPLVGGAPATSNWFETNVFKPGGFSTTIASMIMTAMRKTLGVISATYVDRDAHDIAGKGRLHLSSMLNKNSDLSALNGAVRVFDFPGVKDAEGNIRFGFGGTDANTIAAAIDSAVDIQTKAGTVPEVFQVDGVASIIESIIAPAAAAVSLKTALERVIDSCIVLRAACYPTEHLVVVYNQQDATNGRIQVWRITAAQRADVDGDTFADFEVTPPETVVSAAAAARLFGE
jgi:hypothetical protein